MTLLRGPDGEREIEDGKPFIFKEGEVIVRGSPPSGPSNVMFRIAEEMGFPFGDVVAILAKPIAATMGKTNCTSCAGKQMALNFATSLVKKHGALGGMAKLKELWKLAKEGDPNAVAERIKELI